MLNIKNVLKGILLVGAITVGLFATGEQQTGAIEQVTPVKAITESNENYYVEDGDNITEYSNGAYSVYNHCTDNYEVYFDELGDWGYSANTQQEVNRIIDSYNLVKEDTNNTKDFYVTNTYVKDNNVFTEYNDLSWSRYNLDKNEYEFYPAITEDSSIILNNMDELNNIIATYKSIKETGMY